MAKAFEGKETPEEEALEHKEISRKGVKAAMRGKHKRGHRGKKRK